MRPFYVTLGPLMISNMTTVDRYLAVRNGWRWPVYRNAVGWIWTRQSYMFERVGILIA